ncbi:hypothetical protein BTO01_22470 [Vibrio jasicida]|nr:hypothetical protein BTO01_22470 [Vibrio jasicida]
MIENLLEMISSYAVEEGFEVYGSRLTSKRCYYDLKTYKLHIDVYINGKTKPFYRIESIKDGVNFCLIISSVEQLR